MRLLLVGPEEDAVGSITIGLRLRGHRVERATSGLIAFSLATDNLNDAILVDQTLPYLFGVEVVRHLRWRQIRQPIILLSANGSQGHRRIAEEAGANALLIKPVTIDDIETTLTALRHPEGNCENRSGAGVLR